MIKATAVVAGCVLGWSTAMALTHEQAEKVRKKIFDVTRPAAITAPETGKPVMVFQPDVDAWVNAPWKNRETIDKIIETLGKKKSHHIALNSRNLVSAAATDNDETSATNEACYDAVWIRDSMFIYFGWLGLGETEYYKNAGKLIKAIWDYYASDDQMKRMDAVTKNPELARDEKNGAMAVPHIRFDGASENFEDVRHPDQSFQDWNHKQNDAHGLFLIGIAMGVEEQLLNYNDFTPNRLKALSKLIDFLAAIKYWEFRDAGHWEEVERLNTSSVALVTQGLHLIEKLIDSGEIPSLSPRVEGGEPERSLAKMKDRGCRLVKSQLEQGGESPSHNSETETNLHRKADSALLSLIHPSPLYCLEKEDVRKVVEIVATLSRPIGQLRYEGDSYQGGNKFTEIDTYHNTGDDQETLTGNTSSVNAFSARKNGVPENSEAQWFFDSVMSLAYMHLADLSDTIADKKRDIRSAVVHLKRSLGQITGERCPLDAQGNKVASWQFPESYNTVVLCDERRCYPPSPIARLNWAITSNKLALHKIRNYIDILNQPDY